MTRAHPDPFRPGVCDRMLVWLSLGLALAIVPSVVSAHPHVWVEAKSEVVFGDDGRINAVRHAWRFDEAYSAFATQGLDEDRDGTYSIAELAPLAQINAESLSDYEFFTFLYVEGKDVQLSGAQNYWLEFDAGLLTLFFVLPVQEPVAISAETEVALDVFDPEYFVSFSFVDDNSPVSLINAPTNCGVEILWAEGLDPMTEAMLAAIPMDQPELPPELRQVTQQLANTALVSCG